jgi:cation transport protein ChaC
MLERDDLRRSILEQDPGAEVLADAELLESIDHTLAAGPRQVETSSGVWVFGYGSLLWNPCLDTIESRKARLYGFHRDCCLRETDGRGSPRLPGVTLALSAGGSCNGIALRVTPDNLHRELLLLWRREMVTNVYVPRWVRMWTSSGAIFGIAFTVNREHPAYLGQLPAESIARYIASGRGHLGACIDYFDALRDQLSVHGIRDQGLDRLHRIAQAHHFRGGSSRR